MFDLRVLGPPSISATDGRGVEALARQPRRIALLAYLAAGANRRRDRVLALFWPESDETHARASLSQALYMLRRALGENAIVSSSDDELGLNAEVIGSDVAAFEAALAANRPEEALALYRGDLLDGFFISAAPEFERWVEDERARLRRRAADAAWSLAETNADAGRVIEAERWARRAADLLLTDEAVVRQLMSFLTRLGDRAAAIDAYEAYARRLAQEYDLQPSDETRSLAAAIRREQAPPSTVSVPPLPGRPEPAAARIDGGEGTPRIRLAWVGGAVAAGVVGVIAAIAAREPSRLVQPTTRFTLTFAGQPALSGGIGGNTIALSPDGDHLVYLGQGPQGDQLFVRPMTGLEAEPIPDTRGARHPFFSPDGEWLAFLVGSSLRKVRISGGPVIPIATVSTNVSGASWGDKDIIVFATPSGLWQVSASGGEPSMLALSDTARGERFRWPDVLPGGHAVLVTRADRTGLHLARLSVTDRSVIPLSVLGTHPRFVEPDHLIYARMDGVLLRVRFDPKMLRIMSRPVPITEGLYVGNSGNAKLSVSRTGALAFVPEYGAGPLVVVDRAGRADTLPIGTHRFHSPRFSPDGRSIVTSILAPDGSQDLWVVDRERATMRQITFDSASVEPVWSPAGRRIVCSRKPAARGFGWELVSMAVDGSQEPDVVVPPAINQLAGGFSPDGEWLVFERMDPRSGKDIWTVPLHGERTPRRFLDGRFNQSAPAVSPDGNWLAYVSDQSGRDEIHVVSFPRPGAPVQITFDGGRRPRWASSRALVYRTTNGFAAADLEISRRTVLVRSRAPAFGGGHAALAVPGGEAYGVHPDGNHLVVVSSAPRAGDVMVLLNWFAAPRAARR